MVAHLKQNLIKYKKYILAILLTLFFSALFVPANFKGKSPIQSDDTQYKGAASELHKYGSTGDSTILWTNALFSGMPSYAIAKPNDGAVIKSFKVTSNASNMVTTFLIYIVRIHHAFVFQCKTMACSSRSNRYRLCDRKSHHTYGRTQYKSRCYWISPHSYCRPVNTYLGIKSS